MLNYNLKDSDSIRRNLALSQNKSCISTLCLLWKYGTAILNSNLQGNHI